MPNIVDVVVRVTSDAASGLSKAKAESARAGDEAGRSFESGFRSHLENLSSGMSSKLGNLGKSLSSGAGLFTAGSAGLALAGPIGAAGAALGAFGAVAIPVLDKVKTANQALTKAQQQYTDAVTNKQRQAALLAEQHATEGLTGSQKQLLGQVGQLSKMWDGVQASLTPVVVSVAQVGVSLLQDLMPAIKTLATAGGSLLESLLGHFGELFRSPVFAEFSNTLARVASQIGPLLGNSLEQLLTIFMRLFIQIMPSGVKILQALLPVIVQFVADLAPAVVIIAKLISSFLQWLEQTKLLKPALIALGLALAAALDTNPIGLAIAAIAALVIAITEFARHWSQIWAGVKRIVSDAIDFISAHWRGIINILLGPVGFAIGWIVSNFGRISGAVSNVVGYIRYAWSSVYSAIVSPVWSAVNTVFNFFNQIISFAASIPSRVMGFLGNIGGAIGSFFGFAAGGAIGAASGGPRSNLVMVGEHGRELVRLPVGSTVHSNPDTERMLASGGASGGRITVYFDFGNGSDELVRILRKAIRVKGGDVQTVLGHG